MSSRFSTLLLLLTLLPTPSLTTPTTNNTTCPDHPYTIHIFSTTPLILYIRDFLSASEASHLSSLSSTTFTSSLIADATGQQHLASTRTSRSTSLTSDPIVSCIEARALSFQGLDTARERLEPLQLVKYEVGEKYHAHTDWFTSEVQTGAEYGGNRLSSFFVYVEAEEVVGGGTRFPHLDAPAGEEWCGVVNCDAEWGDGVVFRPIARNAIFWRNLNQVKGKNGQKVYVGDRKTLHAGLPVQKGRKLGMNIWTRERALDEKYRSTP